ncbi:MAG: GTP-binding protein, partial [archaeon]|nr:GTP-binding protein [archaeon]
MGIFDFLKRTTKNKVVFCGLDSSGKSTIISFLQTGTFIEHTPTMGKSRTNMEIQGNKIALFDMGGQKDFRQFWIGEMNDAKCIVFIIDKSNPKRFGESKEELGNLIPMIKNSGHKLIIIANKCDITNSVTVTDIIKEFDLMKVDNCEIYETSAKTGYGLADAFAKIYSHLTGELIKKTVMAKAISIFDKAGLPLITRSSENELDEQILQGGFLSAITSFANTQLDSHSISFKKENGTFLVIRSENYIGSLLWNQDLSIPIEES